MPIVYRIYTPFRNQKHVIISTGLHTLPEDKNWKGDGKAVEGMSLLFDRGTGTGLNSELVYACMSDNENHADQFPILIVEIHSFENSWIGQNCRLRLVSHNAATDWNGKVFESEDTAVVGEATTFQLNSRSPGSGRYHLDAPFGFWGHMEFHLIRAGSSDWRKIGDLDLEFYCLSSRDLPSIFDNGIPLQLLRMFVAAYKGQHGQQNNLLGDWIELVVGIVHGSRKPYSGEPCKTIDHWLRYESENGTYSFTPPNASGINVQTWLEAYNKWKTHGTYTNVNCYDQAAITEVALTLGIHHRQIHWEYHQVYGFIREAELVGWGQCNNPYFKDNIDNIVRADLRDPKREPFRNHAYLSWTSIPFTDQDYDDYNARMRNTKTHIDYLQKASEFEQAKGVEMLMIDSCAGPHNGTETRAEYERTIELILDPATCFSDYVREDYRTHPDRWQEEHSLSAGITKFGSCLPTTSITLHKANQYAAEPSRLTDLISSTETDSSTYSERDQFQQTLKLPLRACMEECHV